MKARQIIGAAIATIVASGTAHAATLYTPTLDAGLASVICRVANVGATPMANVQILVLDGNGGTLNFTTPGTLNAGQTLGLVGPSGVGAGRCKFIVGSKSRVRATAAINNGNLAADGVVVSAN